MKWGESAVQGSTGLRGRWSCVSRRPWLHFAHLQCVWVRGCVPEQGGEGLSLGGLSLRSGELLALCG